MCNCPTYIYIRKLKYFQARITTVCIKLKIPVFATICCFVNVCPSTYPTDAIIDKANITQS